MQIKKIADIHGSQDGAFWGNFLFRFAADGCCRVYDISEKHNGVIAPKYCSEFFLDRREEIVPHSNAVMFGKEYYQEGDEFPLFYSNIYNNYASAEDPLKGVCCVYRLQREGMVFTSTLVQLIAVGFTEDSGLWCSADKNDIRPYGNFTIDREQGLYHAFVMRDAAQMTRYFTFPLPKVREGVTDEKYGVKKVVLGKEDILAQFDCEYHRFVQGACCHGGRIYSVEGFTDSVENPPALRVIDVEGKRQERCILFSELGLHEEAEMIDFKDDICYYSDVHGRFYVIDFEEGEKKTEMTEKGNVLVIGNSGVGKSTLINAVLGEECAVTGFGTSGTTGKLDIYENDAVPFRIIDTVGFEPSLIKEMRAINAVKKWSRESAGKGGEDRRINVIWFCVEGTSSKLFPKAIKDLTRATAMWPSVPVIAVITKSYSVPDREKNIEMVKSAFAGQKRYADNLKQVIPVVASTYVLNESAYAAPEGITELIDATNRLLPEGIQAAETDISTFNLSRKRAMAHSVVAAAAAGGVVVGAVPIPFSDALILGPVEVAEVNALAQIYGISKDEQTKKFLKSIVEVGTVSVVARSVISALKAIPGLNIGASVLNAVIAGCIVAALGEGSIYAFEQIYLGKKSTADIEWMKELVGAKLNSSFVEKAGSIAKTLTDKSDSKTIAKVITELFTKNEK